MSYLLKSAQGSDSGNDISPVVFILKPKNILFHSDCWCHCWIEGMQIIFHDFDKFVKFALFFQIKYFVHLIHNRMESL